MAAVATGLRPPGCHATTPGSGGPGAESGAVPLQPWTRLDRGAGPSRATKDRSGHRRYRCAIPISAHASDSGLYRWPAEVGVTVSALRPAIASFLCCLAEHAVHGPIGCWFTPSL